MPGRLYAELGLNPGCDAAAVDLAYRARRVGAHPDKHHGNDELWRRLQRVYEVLGDPRQRSLYDQGWIDDADVLGGEDVVTTATCDTEVLVLGGVRVVVDAAGREHQLHVPAGSRDGTRVRLEGAGRPGSPPGALVVTLVETRTQFRRRGLRDLEVTVQATWLELYRRDVVRVPVPRGGWRSIELPESGPLAPVLRVAEPGYDLYVRVRAVAPPPGDASLCAALERLQAGFGDRLREEDARVRSTTAHKEEGREAPPERPYVAA